MGRRNFGTAIPGAAMVLCFTAALAYAGDGDSRSWNKDRAAKYLDERGQAWFEFKSAERGERANKSSCVSCHTLVPYALARPVLRRLTGATQPTELEKRLIAQTMNRVEHWQQLDSKELKKILDSSRPGRPGPSAPPVPTQPPQQMAQIGIFNISAGPQTKLVAQDITQVKGSAPIEHASFPGRK